MIPVEEKLTRLRRVYLQDDDQKEIDQMEREIRRQIVATKLGERAEIESIVEDATQRIVDINTLLAYDMNLTEAERRGLDKERKVHMFYIERFDPKRARKILKSIEKYVDSKL